MEYDWLHKKSWKGWWLRFAFLFVSQERLLPLPRVVTGTARRP